MTSAIKTQSVLYVDDEPQALKYFKKAFEKDFDIHTASSAQEALEIIRARPKSVGILMTDQRMPGGSGVKLLAEVQRDHPEILRILTTAYADLDEAIEAVNSGAIYKYVVKPWEFRDLRVVLMRGMEFVLLQRERDALLREKISILHRLMVTDRVRSLSYMAAGLAHHIRNSMTALKTFLDLAPQRLREEVPTAKELKNPGYWGDFWLAAESESHRILKMVHEVVATVVTPSYAFAEVEPLETLVRRALEHEGLRSLAKNGRVDIKLQPALPPLRVDGGMAQRLLEILLLRMVELSKAGGRLHISSEKVASVWGVPGVRIRIQGDGPAWDEDMIYRFFTPLSSPAENPKDWGLDLLSAFFIAIHHGGDVSVNPKPPAGPGFEILLPFDPEASQRPALEDKTLQEILRRYGSPES